jgi:hypothetical protein
MLYLNEKDMNADFRQLFDYKCCMDEENPYYPDQTHIETNYPCDIYDLHGYYQDTILQELERDLVNETWSIFWNETNHDLNRDFAHRLSENDKWYEKDEN